MTTKLERFTLEARAEPQTRFTALTGLLWELDGLRASFGRQDGRKRPESIRYADDYAACFEHEADARAFMEAMSARLAQFDLEAEPSTTALLEFGSAMYCGISGNVRSVSSYMHVVRNSQGRATPALGLTQPG